MKNTEIETSRQNNLDLLRAVAIIAMVFCHAVIRLGIRHNGYEEEFLFFLGEVVLGEYFCVAHAFMFAMGFSLAYSHKHAPADLMRRGIQLYLMAYVLNFFRYGMYALGRDLITGVYDPETLPMLFGQDILQFAGLAQFFTGVLKQLKLREVHILVVGVALSVIGTVLPFVDTGSYALNWLVGQFVFTTWETSCFVFFNWYIFVAAGLFFGTVYHGTEEGKHDLLYKRLLIISGCVMVVYIAASFVYGAWFLCPERNYYATGTLEAVGLLSIDLTLLSAFYFLLKRVPAARFRVFLEMSRDLTQIYAIHWCILGFIDSIFCYSLGVVFPWAAIYLIGAALVVVSYWIAKLWKERKQAAAAA